MHVSWLFNFLFHISLYCNNVSLFYGWASRRYTTGIYIFYCFLLFYQSVSLSSILLIISLCHVLESSQIVVVAKLYRYIYRSTLHAICFSVELQQSLLAVLNPEFFV